jgi:glycogen synthase
MRVSVVINTYNRAESLRKTLQALRYQTFADFEVVVVNGPSTDGTAGLLQEFGRAIRVGSCPEVHLAKSRNVGIGLASGEVVAFIDDDAIPEQGWLAELVEAYRAEDVGGAGGIVYDYTGTELQYEYSVCSRVGQGTFPSQPPDLECLRPGADPFVYLQGTNCSFRRKCLVEIGGFDEEIEYFLDEVEVCLQMIDRGFKLRALRNAAVHHKYLPSHLRGRHNKVVYNPYPSIKNLFYFALQNGRATRSLMEVLAVLSRTVQWSRSSARGHLADGTFTQAQYDFFMSQLERGVEVGISRGLHQPRRREALPPPEPPNFGPFPTVRTAGRRRAFCFLSQEYPPGEIGGIGRFTYDLAVGIAARGHRVHVVTRSPDVKRVDFEDGVWVHRLTDEDRTPAELQDCPLKHNLHLIARVYHEVCRIHERTPVDVVSGPLWLCEGMMCALDTRFATVLSLMTSMKTIAAVHPSMPNPEHINQLIALEKETATRAPYIHAISQAILEKVREEHGVTTPQAHVVPLGIQDRREQFASQRGADGRVNVVLVGRMERRKGIDLFLRAAADLIPQFPQAEFTLVGKDTPYTELGTTYREAFAREYRDRPEILGRVKFAGQVSEAELYRHYADADVVCLPSRFESFGLVLVEAMMFGKPVVASAVGGMQEIVREGVNGLLARPEDAASLTDALRRLLESADLRREFGARSRELFERHFSAEIMVQNTLACYERVAQAHQAARGGRARRGIQDPDTVLKPLAEVVHGATGLPAEAALRYAACLLSPCALGRGGARPRGTLARVRGRLGKVPVVGPLLRRGGRLAASLVRALQKIPGLRGGRLPRGLRKVLRRVPVLGKCLRYAKRVLLMPRAAFQVQGELQEVRSQVDALLRGHRAMLAGLYELIEQQESQRADAGPHPARARLKRFAAPDEGAEKKGPPEEARLVFAPPAEERKAG